MTIAFACVLFYLAGVFTLLTLLEREHRWFPGLFAGCYLLAGIVVLSLR